MLATGDSHNMSLTDDNMLTGCELGCFREGFSGLEVENHEFLVLGDGIPKGRLQKDW
jgi:hypothetical protein